LVQRPETFLRKYVWGATDTIAVYIKHEIKLLCYFPLNFLFRFVLLEAIVLLVCWGATDTVALYIKHEIKLLCYFPLDFLFRFVRLFLLEAITSNRRFGQR
jgi:hypothetical protein